MPETIKVLTVFGTRPEAIKMAPLVHELAKNPRITSICCVTAQHREMLDSVLEIFEITPDFDLDIMEPSQTLSTITAKTLTGLDRVLDETKPDLVLVHGDTSTTFTAALSAFYHQIPVGHVEAGLRTFDKHSPFPEELNRTMVSKIADLHFCPTQSNLNNLENEAITKGLFLTGNTVIDAMKITVKEGFQFGYPLLNTIDFQSKKVVLVTCHRRENYGAPMAQIMTALGRLADDFAEQVELIYPVHLSPVVQKTANEYLAGRNNVHLIPPLGVDELHNLMARCHFVMTDSGGLQEEAPSLGKPVLVLRQETERPEAVTAGTAKLAGVTEDEVYRCGAQLVQEIDVYEQMAKARNPYGDGNACPRIVDAILWHFGMKSEKPSPFTP